MVGRNFMELLGAQQESGRLVCVGLDSEFDRIPTSVYRSGNEREVDVANTMVAFNTTIVDATKDIAGAYKLNSAFYEAQGTEGLSALHRTIAHIRSAAREVPVILDAKRADIGNTNGGYARMAFDWLQADAITVHPYLGQEALKPFLDRADRGVIILCRTSNPGAGELQDLRVHIPREECDELMRMHVVPVVSSAHNGDWTNLSNHVAYRVAKHWNANGNCALVVGATAPVELTSIRKIVGDMPILIPGIGAQGGDLEATVKAGCGTGSPAMVINSSRGIIFASDGLDFTVAARRETLKLHEQIEEILSDMPFVGVLPPEVN